MTTVQSTLKMFDAMSGPLKSITNGMNIMVSTMHKMQDATNRNTNIDKSLKAAKNQIASAETEIRKNIEQATRAQNNFKNSVNESNSKSKDLANSLKRIAAVYVSIEGAKRLFGSTIGAAMEQQSMIDTFSARTGNVAQGQAIFDQLSKQALKYGQDVKASLMGAQSFMSNTMDPEKLGQLNMLAMRLSKLNPEEGLKGAAFSLKELLSGDYTSIAERFNISRSMLKDSEARAAGLRGDVEGFIKAMDDMLNKQNMTQAAFEKMLDSPAAKWTWIIQTFKFKMASAGREALKALEPLLNTIGKTMTNGGFDKFFTVLQKGLAVLARIINSVIKGVTWLFKTLSKISIFKVSITQVFNTIQIGIGYLETGFSIVGGWISKIVNMIERAKPIIIGLLAAIATIWIASMITSFLTMLPVIWANVAALWAMVPPLIAQAAAWVAAHWPILLVAAAIGGLIYWMAQSGVTMEQVAGTIMGAFAVIKVYFENMIIVMKNGWSTFSDFFQNMFIDPVYAVKKLFYDLVLNVLDNFYEMTKGAEDFAGGFVKVIGEAINGILKGVQKMVDALSLIPGFGGLKGTTIDLVDTTKPHGVSDLIGRTRDNFRDNFKPTSDKNIVNTAKIPVKTAEDYKNAWSSGYNQGAGIINKASNALNKVINGAYNLGGEIPKVSEVGKVGKIEDSVDISSEDLKMMRELAEMKSIQNFVSLTPTVHLTTGDINSGDDLDTIMEKITQVIEEDIASAAAGSYA